MPNEPGSEAEAAQTVLFLSYARDDRVRAEKLASALRSHGFEVWWDALIEGGAQFASTISEALDKADAVLVLWSANSIESDWVRDEAATGRDRHRLVPLSLDGSKPPLGFRQYQAINLSRWRGREDAREIAAIIRAVGTVSHAPMPKVVRQKGISRRTMIGAGAGAGALVAAGGVTWAVKEGVLGGGEAHNSIAVLPFKDLGADKEQAYFAEGLTEEVRASLRRIAGLKVLAATSSEAASEEKADAKTIARKLDVAWLLEGSAQLAADKVRIAVNLTDGDTGFSQWSTKVDRKLTDIFALQSEIAALVARAMSITIVPAEAPKGGTKNVEAYEHFLRGRALFNLGKDEPTDRAALAQYDAAIGIDPQFARAHAARSRVIAAIAVEYAPASQLKLLYDDAIRAAQRAIDIAPDLAEAQLAMGFALFTGRLDVARARPFYDRAHALAHGNADILLLFALYCSRAGRAEHGQMAIAEALALDPLNARTHRASGSIEYAARNYRAALAPLARALELNPNLSNAHSLVGYSKMMLGDLPGAAKAFEAEPHDIFRLSGLAIAKRRMGNEAAARRYFDQLVSEAGDAALYQQAQVLAQWGRKDEAIAALEKAHTVGDSGLIYFATDPLLDPLRKEPGFARLGREMALS